MTDTVVTTWSPQDTTERTPMAGHIVSSAETESLETLSLCGEVLGSYVTARARNIVGAYATPATVAAHVTCEKCADAMADTFARHYGMGR